MIGERFTREARQAVLDSAKEAERAQANEVDSPHLLLALLDSPVLADYGLSRESVETALSAARRKGGLSEADTEALRGLGIDVDKIVDSIEQSLGEGALATMKTRKKRRLFGNHVPFGQAAKQTLVRSLTEAKDLGADHLGNEHLVLALLAGGGLVTEVMEAQGVTYADLRQRIAARA
jgi:ATP-dependent Clp protease ATP-binding subunit ClpA